MKKIIMLLCFIVNGGLLAMNKFQVDSVIFQRSCYSYNKSAEWYDLVDKDGLYGKVLGTCLNQEGLLVPESVTAYFEGFVQEGSRRGVNMGKQSVGLKQVIMKSSRTQKFGYACVGACAAFGLYQLCSKIRRKLRKEDK